MKALCLVLVVCFVGCGGGATYKPECVNSTDCSPTQACNDGKCVLRECTISTDCTGSQKCDLGVCIDQECWSDNDCEKSFRCADGVCIEKPECIDDTECDAAQGLVCQEYKCVAYLTKDQCNGLACTGTCQNCGPLTFCYKETCQDACRTYEAMRDDARDAGCLNLSDRCPMCNCWNDSHKSPRITSHDVWECLEAEEYMCTEDAAIELKVVLTKGSEDWEAITTGTRNSCNNY